MSLSPVSSAWQPPPGYVPLASAVPGISVYAPAPESAPAEQPTTFKCPKCGAATRFDVAAGGVTCEHCGFQAQAATETVGRAARESEFTLETLSRAEHGWGVERRVLHCSACGAELALAEGALTATCPFCASNAVDVRAAADDQLRPRFLIPFKLKPDEVRARAREWLGRGWYHPPSLASSAGLAGLTGLYLPFWTFDAQITARWRAEVGHERTERHYDSHRRAWRTRRHIDWRWESGQVSLAIDDHLVSGSSHVSQVILERVQGFNLGDLVTYAPDFLAGWQAHAYDVTLPEAWESGKARMREEARRACYRDTGSSHVRNFSMTADFADESWRYVLLPVYLSSYRFESRVFQLMANGQTGQVSGQKPVEWWKVWLAIVAMLLPGLCLGISSLPLMLAGGIGMVPLMLGGVALAAGIAFAVRLYRQAVASEAV